ncbi:MAG: hypothetical protein ABIJ92_00285 [Candidatus Aenigmatarchaeota archaeon]
MKILVTYGWHRGEYTKPVAIGVAEILTQRGYDVELEEIPFEKTGWGKAFADESLYEVEEATCGLVSSLRYFGSRLGTHLILDFHAGSETEFNPGGVDAKELGFKNELNFAWGKDNSILFQDAGNEVGVEDNLYIIEIPQVYRRASDRFLETVTQRVEGDMRFNGSVIPLDRKVGSYFESVADKKATQEKYPTEILARKITDGVEEQIIGRFKEFDMKSRLKPEEYTELMSV